ncbi:TPR repeat region-containing protein [Nocardiopsis alba]
MPKNECDIDSGKVDSARQDYDNLFSKISGRSGEYNLITEPVSFDFSGLVAENLRSAANENQSAWQGSMSACSLAFGVLSEVYEAVVEYDEKLDDIQSRYNTYVKNLGDTLQPDSITVMQSFQTEADTALTTLRTRCDWAEEKLESGATPESMRALAAAGHFGEYGQIGYYINEDLNYYHVDETQAETIAVHLRDGVLEGRGGSIEALEDNPELLALITNVALRANTAERNGEKLTDGEIAFLETIHEELEIGENGFLDFLDQVKSSEHISDSLREEINRSLANGTLALSNEVVGGGVDLLPNDIQETITGRPKLDVDGLADGDNPQNYVNSYNSWGSDFNTLADYLSSSSPGIKGGTDFSATLLATTANNLHYVDFYPDGPDDSAYQKILDVAARNPEANNIMLTGKDFDGNVYEHHEKNEGITPESFLEVIYSRDWPDDGQAASKVTDWISDFSASDDEEKQDWAGEAAASLISILAEEPESNKDKNPFLFTGVERGDNPSIAVTELNPELAGALADVFMAYLDDMTIDNSEDDSGYFELSGDREDISIFHENGENVLVLTKDDREGFIQLLVANDDMAPNIIAATEAQERRIIEEVLLGVDIHQETPGVLAAGLRTSLDNALIQEYEDREMSSEDAIKKTKEQWEKGYSVFTAVASGAAGAANPALGVGTSVVLEIMKDPYKNFVEEMAGDPVTFNLGDNFMKTIQDRENHSNLQALAVMVDLGMIDMDVLEEEGLLVGEEGNKRLPVTMSDWNVFGESYIPHIRDLIRDNSGDKSEEIAAYIERFSVSHDPEMYSSRVGG